METIERLSSIEGAGTSMITMTISKNINKAIKLLRDEYRVTTNIKSRI